jgi:hypothetical protein
MEEPPHCFFLTIHEAIGPAELTLRLIRCSIYRFIVLPGAPPAKAKILDGPERQGVFRTPAIDARSRGGQLFADDGRADTPQIKGVEILHQMTRHREESGLHTAS